MKQEEKKFNIQYFAKPEDDLEDKDLEDDVDDNDDEDYIETIKKIKENSVPKDKYIKLKKQNKELLENVLNGKELPGQDKNEPDVDINALRKELYGPNRKDLSNLDYIQKTLDLRKAIIDKGGKDPMLPVAAGSETPENIEVVENVVKNLEDAIEYADGDSAIFTQELQRRMVDSNPTAGAKIRKQRLG